MDSTKDKHVHTNDDVIWLETLYSEKQKKVLTKEEYEVLTQ